MKRIIKDYKSIDSDLLVTINSLYPDGIGEEDLISFTNTKGETIRAIEIKTDDTIYLIKMSSQLEQKLEEFSIEEPKIDDDLGDYFDMGSAPDDLPAEEDEEDEKPKNGKAEYDDEDFDEEDLDDIDDDIDEDIADEEYDEEDDDE